MGRIAQDTQYDSSHRQLASEVLTCLVEQRPRLARKTAELVDAVVRASLSLMTDVDCELEVCLLGLSCTCVCF